MPWAIVNDMVQYAGRLYLPPASPLVLELLEVVHGEDHEGVQRTLHQLHRDFHFPNMKQVVQDFVRTCATCQRYKSEHLHPMGLLLPLPVPQGCGRTLPSTSLRFYLAFDHFDYGGQVKQVMPLHSIVAPLLRRVCRPSIL